MSVSPSLLPPFSPPFLPSSFPPPSLFPFNISVSGTSPSGKDAQQWGRHFIPERFGDPQERVVRHPTFILGQPILEESKNWQRWPDLGWGVVETAVRAFQMSAPVVCVCTSLWICVWIWIWWSGCVCVAVGYLYLSPRVQLRENPRACVLCAAGLTCLLVTEARQCCGLSCHGRGIPSEPVISGGANCC